MSTTTVPAPVGSWLRADTGDDTVAVAERPVIGTTARVAVWPPARLGPALAAVDRVVADLDRQASRFRPDSEIAWIHDRGGGLFMLSDGLAGLIGVALAAARWTGGRTDPTVGNAVIALGYDRDFTAVDPDGQADGPPPGPAPGCAAVRLDGCLLRLPHGITLDLGATAKGVGADRAADAARRAVGPAGGVLVSLGGDIAVAGTPPQGGWPVLVADQPEPGHGGPVQLVRLPAGAVATSSVTCRKWRRSGRVLHHIVDPRTGQPADGPWRTVSVAAATCADANAAATAAIVAGTGALDWLAEAGPPGPAGVPRRHGHAGRRLASRRQRAAHLPAGLAGLRCAAGREAAVSAAASLAGQQGLWFLSRASGLTLLVASTSVLVLGIAARTGAAPGRLPRFVPAELHRNMALFSVAFLVLHVVTALLDPFVTIGWAATVLPFLSGYRPLAIGLGALAVDLGGAVLLTSLLRGRLGYRRWRAVHWLAYLAWPVAFAHSLTAGGDLHIWWVALIEWGCGAAAATALLARAFHALAHRDSRSSRARLGDQARAGLRGPARGYR